MSNDSIRKKDSLTTSAAKLHSEFKESHARYNDLVGEFALLTKSELMPIVNSLKEKQDINGIKNKAMTIFENIANVLFDMVDTHLILDEIVQNVGGLEFSTDNTVDKLSEILRDQENQQARMTKDIGNIKTEFEKTNQDNTSNNGILEDLEEFLIEFSRFQDYVQDSIPRVSRLFDELDNEGAKGVKFGKTHKI